MTKEWQIHKEEFHRVLTRGKQEFLIPEDAIDSLVDWLVNGRTSMHSADTITGIKSKDSIILTDADNNDK